jgi:hypothetical protein
MARDPNAIRLYEQDEKKTPEAAPDDFHQSLTNRYRPEPKLSVQSPEMSLLVLSLSIAVASSEMIAQPRMNTAIGVAER